MTHVLDSHSVYAAIRRNSNTYHSEHETVSTLHTEHIICTDYILIKQPTTIPQIVQNCIKNIHNNIPWMNNQHNFYY